MAYLPPINGGRVNVTLAGNSTSAGAGFALVSSGSLTLAGGNNITLSQNGNAITMSAFNQTAQTQNIHDVTLAGNLTSAGAGYINISSGTMTLAGGNNITLSQNGNAITMSAYNQTVQTQNLVDMAIGGNSTSAGAGYITMSSGTVTLFGGNNVTLSQNGNSLAISAYNQTVQTQNLIDVTLAGNSTSAGAGYALASSGTLTLAGGNNITLSQNGNAVTVSGAAQPTLYTYEPYPIYNSLSASQSVNTSSNTGSVYFYPFQAPQNVAVSYINMLRSMSILSGGFVNYSQTFSKFIGLYTRGTGVNSTILGSVTSNSFSMGFSYSRSSMTISYPTTTASTGYGYGSTSSNTSNIISYFTGLKEIQMYMSYSMTPGNYWLGVFDFVNYSNSSSSGMLQTHIGNSLTVTNFAPIGQLSSVYTSGTNIPSGQGNWNLGHGYYSSAGINALPVSVALSGLTHNLTFIPYMKFVGS